MSNPTTGSGCDKRATLKLGARAERGRRWPVLYQSKMILSFIPPIYGPPNHICVTQLIEGWPCCTVLRCSVLILSARHCSCLFFFMFAGLHFDVFCKLDAIRYQVANLIHCSILTTPRTNHEQIQNGNIDLRPTDAFVQTAVAVL